MEQQPSKVQRILKHVLLWIVFSYCYNSAISLLVKMAVDKNPTDPFITSILYCTGFSILSAHLITKYDKYWPVIAAVFIAIVGIVVFPLLLVGSAGLLDIKLIALQVAVMPVASLLMLKLKDKMLETK